jgi:hypothetical protein
LTRGKIEVGKTLGDYSSGVIRTKNGFSVGMEK